jgi:hypothetical protein
MNDSYFGEAPADEREPTIGVIWPLRAANLIEGELNAAMADSLALEAWRVPMVWLENDEFTNAHEYVAIYDEELTAREALTLQDIVFGAVVERYRRQLIIARECGERASLADYLAACAAEQINPLLKGSPNDKHP